MKDPIISKDGKRMVYIPGGKMLMGSDKGYPEEKPVHEIEVAPFYMDENLVTNAEYRAFCDATGTAYPRDPRWADMPGYFLNYPDHPVVNINNATAQAYAAWAGKRLPTEEEWEFAAAGGLDAPTYPWGEDDPDGSMANFADKNCEHVWRDSAVDDGYKYTSPVGSYPPNGYGLYDMAGNVYQLVEDWFFRYDDKVHNVEAFKDGWGGSRVARGGCYYSIKKDLRIARRFKSGGATDEIGFRCVKDLEGVVHEERDKLVYKTSPTGWEKMFDGLDVRIRDGQELCVGIGATADPTMLRRLKAMGVTSVEQYVTWQTCENEAEGAWDFSHWDAELEKVRAAGLKWLPFIIAGPAYSLPDWYREHRDFEGLVCLNHNIESKVQTFWDKSFYRYVERFLKKLAEHYADHDVFEGLLFGITGDFGEAIVPVWGGSSSITKQIPGLYHTHAGYWCGDRYARRDFIRFATEKYGTIENVQKAWGITAPTIAAITPPPIKCGADQFRIGEPTSPCSFVPKTAKERRYWIDFIDWYRASMTDYASFWMKTARKYFPNTELYLCTGGCAEPWQASEFAQQCKISAEVGGGVRITNEASNYNENFVVTDWVASASMHYGSYFSFEPAGQVTERGVVCRVYNAAATGARSLHYYAGNILGNEERAVNFADNVTYLHEGGVRREIALLNPDTPIVLDATNIAKMHSAFGLLRDYTDYAFACDTTIADGILDGLKVLIVPIGGYYKTATLKAIRAFVEAGGLLIGINLSDLRDLDEDADYLDILFGADGRTLGKGKTLLIRGTLGGKIEEASTSSNYTMKNTPEHLRAMQREVCDVMTAFLNENGVYPSDGQMDGVFTAERNGKLIVMNYSKQDVERDFTRPDGTTFHRTIRDLTIEEYDI